MPESFHHPLTRALRVYALSLPEVSEGDSCVNRAFKAGKKNFAFLGERGEDCKLMVKAGEAAEELERLAQEDPEHVSLGKTGWATLRFTPETHPGQERMQAWLTASYRAMATKKLLKQLDAEG